jgi:uncharacterized protein YcbK (DUF882 family)
MSWEIFKQNILAKANNPDSIKDIDTVAKLYATEYDAAIKRGGDTINRVAVKKGNTEIMEQLFKAALQKGLSSTQPYDLVGEMGKGVLAYWQGALLNEFPLPLIPSPGAISNIGVTSNIVTNPGTWTPPITTPSVETPLPEIPTAILLDEIPDDNNTVEGAREIAALTGVEVLADAGDDPGPQLQQVMDELPADNTPYEILTETLSVSGSENENDNNSKNDKEAADIKCGDGVDYDAKVSPNYKLRDLSIACNFRHKIIQETTEKMGLTPTQVVCNLQNVAVNILEPIRKQFPGVNVNSAYRGAPAAGGAAKSQHMKGEAVDLQWPGKKPSEYLEIAQWCIENLPYDQLIFEHGNSIWLHISCKKDDSQRKELLTMWTGYLKYTDRTPPSKYRPGIHLHYKD